MLRALTGAAPAVFLRSCGRGIFEQTSFDLFAILCVLFLSDDPVAQIRFELGKLIAIDGDVCLFSFVVRFDV